MNPQDYRKMMTERNRRLSKLHIAAEHYVYLSETIVDAIEQNRESDLEVLEMLKGVR